MTTIDTRGLSCPEPVLMVKNAIDKGEKELKVLINSATALENIKRLASTNGFNIESTDDGLKLIK